MYHPNHREAKIVLYVISFIDGIHYVRTI